MSARRRNGGRTTPKGTTNPAQLKGSKLKKQSKADARTPAPKKVRESQQWVSRPDSHNRGNR